MILSAVRYLRNSTTRFISSAPNSEEVSQNNESDEEYEKNIKAKILNESLKFVHDYGWSKEAISAGAEAIGYPGIIHGLFPNGGSDLVQHFCTSCNYQISKDLKKEILAIQSDPSATKKPPEKIVQGALEKRIKMLIPYKKTWPQALTIMSIPQNVPTSLANLLTLADDICYYSGDRSVDTNWYVRRITVAGIYKMTELYMLQDESEDHQGTWKFLERRVDDAIQFNKFLTTTSDLPPYDKAINQTSDALNAVFVTARNILGINWKR